MTTLVIHPKDETTDFLESIYAGLGFTVIRDNTSWSNLKRQIKGHDRIIMMGHGNEYGLLGFKRLVIDSRLVYLLREKLCVCIWCNAHGFAPHYRLKGIYTGMIISETQEAIDYEVKFRHVNQIEESNNLFASTMKKLINGELTIEQSITEYNIPGNPIIEYNRQRIFQNE